MAAATETPTQNMPRSRKSASKGVRKPVLADKTPGEKQKERRRRVQTVVDSTPWENYAILGLVDEMIEELFDKEIRLLQIEMERDDAREKVERLTELLADR